ncbi:MAG TPA: 16S rRNA (uracil(1498)-N(3))-methyltransferase [Azospirillaceae bacterium]|nr:16S rRNA (uracil(1498)-N(3))-methyltransferase [Azospirillaceae bacterium]
MADRPRTRLHVPESLAAGAAAALGAGQAHYLRSVLRQGPGDRVLAFNGRDGEWLAEIAQLGKSSGTLALLERTREPVAEPDLWLLFAPLKGGRTEYVVEKATELGASTIWPVFTRRTDVNRVNAERLAANAAEAAEQCERLSVPDLREAAALDAALRGWDPARTLFVAAESGAARPAAAAMAEAAGRPAAVLVGPEGGFDPAELDLLARMAFVVPVGLGPRVLRADTAAFAALSVWQAVAGDWPAGRPPFRHTSP